MIEPFFTASDVVSGNCTVWPKNGVSCCIGAWARTRRYIRLPALSTVMLACAAPPRFSSKNFFCLRPGFPSEIDHATMRPSRGTTNMSRSAPIRVWYAVVREMTSHGLVGQLGTALVGDLADLDDPRGCRGRSHEDERRRRERHEQKPFHDRIQHEWAVDVAVGAAASARAAPSGVRSSGR